MTEDIYNSNKIVTSYRCRVKVYTFLKMVFINLHEVTDISHNFFFIFYA